MKIVCYETELNHPVVVFRGAHFETVKGVVRVIPDPPPPTCSFTVNRDVWKAQFFAAEKSKGE